MKGLLLHDWLRMKKDIGPLLLVVLAAILVGVVIGVNWSKNLGTMALYVWVMVCHLSVLNLVNTNCSEGWYTFLAAGPVSHKKIVGSTYVLWLIGQMLCWAMLGVIWLRGLCRNDTFPLFWTLQLTFCFGLGIYLALINAMWSLYAFVLGVLGGWLFMICLISETVSWWSDTFGSLLHTNVWVFGISMAFTAVSYLAACRLYWNYVMHHKKEKQT